MKLKSCVGMNCARHLLFPIWYTFKCNIPIEHEVNLAKAIEVTKIKGTDSVCKYE
jgi:hypothetical protein